MSTRAVHNLQFSMASNHVSCRYLQLFEPKSVRAADEPSRSRGNDPLRRACLRIIGAFSSLDVGDQTVPLTFRRPRRAPNPKVLRSTRTEPAFPVVSLTDHGFHRPERLPSSRALSGCARPGPYRPFRSIDTLHQRIRRPPTSQPLPSWFSPPRAPPTGIARQLLQLFKYTTRDHIRGFWSPHTLSRARVTSP